MGSGMLLGQETKAINRVDSQTLQSAYKNGLISNAKEINTGSYKGELNRPRLVDTTSTNIPSDLSWGVREVFFFSNSKIVIQITGVDTNSKTKVWYCVGSSDGSTFTIGKWDTISSGNSITTPGTAEGLGLTKLYDSVGDNTDGTMTQSAIKTALYNKAEVDHTHTKEEVGLGNVGNFKAVSTVADQALTDDEKVNARTNIGAGTSSFSGSYNDLTNKPAIPTVGSGKVTINQNGTSKGTFTMNQTGDTVIDLADSITTELKGATTDTAGTAGYAPAPEAGSANRYLRSDGTWAVPPDTNTTYGTGTPSTTGLTKLYTVTGANTDGTMTQNAVTSALNGKAESSHTHSSADISSLDAAKLTGTIDIARLPQGALDRIVRVDDDTARFKLTTSNVQLGDTVKVTSTGKMYYVVDESKLSEADGYEVYTAESATSVPWSGVTGKPSSYTPSTHTHTKSEVGLGNVDNTADADKSVKYATSAGTATNASKVNNHTVNADVPSGAKFTDTNTWRPVETTLSSENLNDITTPGFYNAGGGNTVSNKPSGIEHFGLIVIHRASGSYYTQIIFNDTKSWRRYCVNGTWGNWIEEKITDTTYSTGTASASGLTKLYTSTGTATDGTMTRTAITNALGSYVAKSNVKDYMALFQDTEPSSSSNANFWVNTTESASSIAQYSIPQINDTSTNAVDTWSSNKLNSEFGKTGSCMVFGGTDTTDMSITDTTQHYIPITRTLSNQRDADDYMSCTSDGAILLKPGVYIVSGKIQIASTSAAVTLFSTWNASTDNKTYSVTYETQVSENSTYVANTSNPLNAKLSLNTMTINVTSNTYLKASIQAINSVTLKVAQQACRFQVTKIK